MSWYLDCEFINYIRLQTHKNPLHTVFLDHISGIEIVINTVLSYGSTIYHYCTDKLGNEHCLRKQDHFPTMNIFFSFIKYML